MDRVIIEVSPVPTGRLLVAGGVALDTDRSASPIADARRPFVPERRPAFNAFRAYHVAVSIEQSLFGDDESTSPATEVPPRLTPIGDWQIELIRRALDGRRISEMSERQSLIEAIAGRPLASLRDLSSEEALDVLSTLSKQAPRREATSLWDSREEDTWLDRL